MWAVFLGVLTQFFWWVLPRIFVALGLYSVSDSVSDQIFDFLKNRIDQQVSSIPGQFLNAIYISGLLQAVTLILAASVLAMSIKATKGAISVVGQGGTGTGGGSST